MSENIWHQRNDSYYPGTTAFELKNLPGGIYQYVEPPMGPWYLNKIQNGYNFPYKIYGNNDPIIQRIVTSWEHCNGNLGILFNGLKGTGKTISAQLLANWAVSKNIPVLLISHPIPLEEIIRIIAQPLVILFDEFEKSHAKSEHQQALLTALDGMARNEYKRMFVFTTNERTIDPNFVNRPSRIKYIFEFGRLEDEVIEEVINDMLLPECIKFKTDLIAYILSRELITMDTVKAAITEVNTFKESPSNFEKYMNLSEQNALSFKVEIVNEKGEVLRDLASYFSPPVHERKILSGLLTRSGRAAFAENLRSNERSHQFYDRGSKLFLNFVGIAEQSNTFIAEIGESVFATWLKGYPEVANTVYAEYLWWDAKPEDWTVPEFVRLKQDKKTLNEEQVSALSDFEDRSTVYGTNDKLKFFVRVSPNYNVAPPMKVTMNLE